MRNEASFGFFARLLLLIPIVACSTVPTSINQAQPRPLLRLSEVEKLVVGKTSQTEASGVFGDPDMKVSPSELGGREAWLYLEGKYRATRLSLIFSRPTGVLDAVNWYVNEEDPESDLENAKARLNSGELTKRNADWGATDSAPNETYYFDKKKPLKIVYANTRKKVSAIVWMSPFDRSVANDH